MDEFYVDKLKIYSNKSYININEHINIRTPLLSEIRDIGERIYLNTVNLFCSTPSDLMFQLDDIGIDFTEISEYELFVNYIAPSVDSECLSLLLGKDIDFKRMKVVVNELSKDITLVQHVIKTQEIPKNNLTNKIKKLFHLPIDVDTKTEEYDIVIDRYAYKRITDIIRLMHGLSKNTDMPANKATKEFMIEIARDEYEANKDKPYTSQLFNLVSTMVNMEGFKRNDEDIFNMNIFAFFDSVKRIQKINLAKVLLQSGYSGFGVNLKDVKNEINYFSDLEK